MVALIACTAVLLCCTHTYVSCVPASRALLLQLWLLPKFLQTVPLFGVDH
jgi:hypothetical protein